MMSVSFQKLDPQNLFALRERVVERRKLGGKNIIWQNNYFCKLLHWCDRGLALGRKDPPHDLTPPPSSPPPAARGQPWGGWDTTEPGP